MMLWAGYKAIKPLIAKILQLRPQHPDLPIVMESIKRFVHQIGVAIGKVLAKLLPDRVPATFVGADAVSELCDSIGDMSFRKLLIVTDAMLVEVGIDQAESVSGLMREAGLQDVFVRKDYAGIERVVGGRFEKNG